MHACRQAGIDTYKQTKIATDRQPDTERQTDELLFTQNETDRQTDIHTHTHTHNMSP